MAKTKPQETKFATVLYDIESELDSFSSYMLPRLITEWETQYPNTRMSDHMDANGHLRVCEILNRRFITPTPGTVISLINHGLNLDATAHDKKFPHLLSPTVLQSAGGSGKLPQRLLKDYSSLKSKNYQ